MYIQLWRFGRKSHSIWLRYAVIISDLRKILIQKLMRNFSIIIDVSRWEKRSLEIDLPDSEHQSDIIETDNDALIDYYH